ncbi:DEAD/DEAH box helicase [Paenibacillus sp. J31TS4]|uniref:DEAD/DEAH box helicase n=1 Tax=Paenibacillus sp. J31TS4 TaxID=2807195 RepID=UPI001B007C66|nr:DEAD/DEAH box helicase [Paenibacillus sp. J31TS4]GIP38391.1 DEAD/DEAH box helicase [Paenibacillus sp. J31TS4]
MHPDHHEANRFHPVLAAWFAQSFGQPTDVQLRAWSEIAGGHHTLIASPTGSGKTLAALLPCIDAVVTAKERAAAERTTGVRLLYITPLKALNNDIHHHLFRFAEEWEAAAAELGADWPGVTIGVRTGDTSQSTRASMLRKPPDVLITTPESFYILLTSAKAREMLRSVRQVIVDEIHDLAADKRGAHLSLSLERLASWTDAPFQRIGVSATQKPLERVARFLGGWAPPNGAAAGAEAGTAGAEGKNAPGERDNRSAGVNENAEPQAAPGAPEDSSSQSTDAPHLYGYVPRPVAVVESRADKRYELLVTLPERSARTPDKEMFWLSIVERIVRLMEGSATSLIFVNSRRMCERLTLRLNDYAGYTLARSHHGSVSREKRLEVERMLKAGELRCLVATSSLELGIDVGHVDLVIQIDSPKEVAAGIQRIGRAGHSVGDASRGVLLARTRGELPEAAVIARQIAARDIEAIRIPRHPLDVLSQQIVAMAATDEWEVEELHRTVTRSDSYRTYPLARLRAVLEVLAGLYPFARPLLEWNRDTDRIGRRKNTPMAAIMGAGTIPQSSGYPVHHMETRTHLGELDEEFVFETRVGDVFQLGTSSWTVRSIKHDRIYVTEAANAYSEIPFWRAEALGRSFELGTRIGAFYRELLERLDRAPAAETEEWLMRDYRLDASSAGQLAAYVRSQKAVCPLPTDRRIVAEHFVDDAGQHHLVLHSVFGRKVNRTWQLALQARLSRVIGFDYYANARDNGIEFIFPEWNPVWLSLVRQVSSEALEELLLEAVPATPLLGITFRRLAETSLLLSRSFTRMPAWKMRLRSEELLKEAKPYAEQFPYLREALRETMEDALDMEHVRQLLDAVSSGEVEWAVAETRFPSPFAAQFLMDFVGTSLYESDVLGKDLQLQLMSVSKELAARVFGEESVKRAIRPEAVERERERLEEGRGLQIEDAPSLYRLLKERGDQTERELVRLAGPQAVTWLRELRDAGQAVAIPLGGEERWICRDELGRYEELREEGEASFLLKRFADHRLAFTAEELAARYGLPLGRAQEVIRGWRDERAVEEAPFAEPGHEELWTSTKVTGQMLRFTIREYRREAERVPADRLALLLAERHGLLPGQRGEGPEGLREAIARLQGLFLPVSHWETYLFPARMASYRREDLDLLCASGEVLWIGRREEGDKEGRVAFFLAEARELYAPYLRQAEAPRSETAHPELLALLRSRGASFVTALSRETGLVPSELTIRLLDLVWEGRAANDQFAPLRPLPRGGSARSARNARLPAGLGRWYALEEGAAAGWDEEAYVVTWARHLLERDGVLTREAAKDAPYSWETLSGVLKQLEEWGVATRGMLVQGIQAMQFASRETVEALRSPAPLLGEAILLSAVDPANPYGASVPWPQRKGVAFARKPGNYLLLADGRWVLWIENNGRRITEMHTAGQEEGREADHPRRSGEAQRRPEPGISWRELLPPMLRQMMRQNGLKKLVVEQWNGLRVEQTEAAELLKGLGAEKDDTRYVIWPSALKG